jgi:membrane-bound metal-dependent hydrolase YbcI (DUF457 family)
VDIVSHALMGRALVTKKDSKKDQILVALFGALPDFFQIPLYIFLGYLHQRPFFYPATSDWTGFREAYPTWSMWWEIPHSYFFVLLIVVPLVLFLKINKFAIAAYSLHIFLDLFTHTGEWAVKPFFPLPFMVSGFTDAWAWNYLFYPIVWAVLILMIAGIEKIRSQGQ